MERARRRFACALDGLREKAASAVNSATGGAGANSGANIKCPDWPLDEPLQSQHCTLKTLSRHGFADEPRCLAWDYQLKLLAVGTARGVVRFLGEAGVDVHVSHPTQHPVTHCVFVPGQGQLVTACSNDSLHSWTLRPAGGPAIAQTLQLNKETASALAVTPGGRWLLLGTHKGNVYFVATSSFTLSAYAVHWNKAIDLSSRTHPGEVKSMAVSPTDAARLLLVYEKGAAVVWHMGAREADRLVLEQPVRSATWHCDGRQIMTGVGDGSLILWRTTKGPGGRPTLEIGQRIAPHGEAPPSSSGRRAAPVTHLHWAHSNDGQQLIIFAGGLGSSAAAAATAGTSAAAGGEDDHHVELPAVTVLRAARAATVLELDHPLIDIQPLWAAGADQAALPPAAALLLKNDLFLVDLTQPTYPCFESPHAQDLHESRVSCLHFHDDVPADLIGALALVGAKQRKKGLSPNAWPASGGRARKATSGLNELLLTGHHDGSVRFWATSGETAQVLYKLRTAAHFERLEEATISSPLLSHAVTQIALCAEARICAVAAADAGHVLLFRFSRTDVHSAVAVIQLPAPEVGPLFAAPPATPDVLRRQQQHRQRVSSTSSDTSTGSTGAASHGGAGNLVPAPYKVRQQALRRQPGFQPELACLAAWLAPTSGSSESAAPTVDGFTAMALCSAAGLLVVATHGTLALVDFVQGTLIYSKSVFDLLDGGPLSGTNLLHPADVSPNDPPGSSLSSPTDCCSPCPAPSLPASDSRRPSVFGSLMRRFTQPRLSIAQQQQQQQTAAAAARHNSIAAERPSALRMPLAGGAAPEVARPPVVSPSAATNQNQQHPDDWPTGSTTDTDSAVAMSSAGIGPGAGGAGAFTDRPALEDLVTALHFIRSPGADDGNSPQQASSTLTLYIGVSSGAALQMPITIPADRLGTAVTVPAQTVTPLRLRGAVLAAISLDAQLCLLAGPAETWKGDSSSNPSSQETSQLPPNRVLTKVSLAPQPRCVSSAEPESKSSAAPDFEQLVVWVAEWEARTIALPSQQPLAVHKCDEIPLVKAQATSLRGSPALFCLTAAGALAVYSLPLLKPLFVAGLLSHSLELDHPMCSKVALSEHSMAIYLASPSEIEKVTVCAETAARACAGDVATRLCDPSVGQLDGQEQEEKAKDGGGGASSFLRNVSTLFSGSSRDAFDLDSVLCEGAGGSANPSTSPLLNNSNSASNQDGSNGDASSAGGASGNGPPTGVAMRSVGRTVPGPGANMTRAQGSGVSAGQAVLEAMQKLNERGDKLNATVDATEQLRNNAQSLSQRTGKLVEKFEKKKWYNL